MVAGFATAGQMLDKYWDVLNDIDSEIQELIHLYDVAQSYRGKPGEKGARKVIEKLKSAKKILEGVAKREFFNIAIADKSFTSKYGTPEDYAAKTRAEIFPI